jgi:hypothetical protein
VSFRGVDPISVDDDMFFDIAFGVSYDTVGINSDHGVPSRVECQFKPH